MNIEFQISFVCTVCGVRAVMRFPWGMFRGQLPDLPPPEHNCPRCGNYSWREEKP